MEHFFEDLHIRLDTCDGGFQFVAGDSDKFILLMLEYFSFCNVPVVGNNAIDFFIIKKATEDSVNSTIAPIFMAKPELSVNIFFWSGNCSFQEADFYIPVVRVNYGIHADIPACSFLSRIA